MSRKLTMREKQKGTDFNILNHSYKNDPYLVEYIVKERYFPYPNVPRYRDSKKTFKYKDKTTIRYYIQDKFQNTFWADKKQLKKIFGKHRAKKAIREYDGDK